MTSYKFKVFGKVQGVWYRRYVAQIAYVLDYVGYVKNLSDGSLEIAINLESEVELESFITKLYEGSLLSIVTDVTYEKIDFVEFLDFKKIL